MATSPMMPMMQGAENPTEAAEPGEEMNDGSTELCIKVAPDGQISVYKEGGEAEGAEQAAQPVADIGQALAWCLKEFKAIDQTRGGEQGGFDSVDAPQPLSRGSMR